VPLGNYSKYALAFYQYSITLRTQCLSFCETKSRVRVLIVRSLCVVSERNHIIT